MGLVHRRRFLAATGVLFAAPRAVAQQRGRLHRVGVLTPFRIGSDGDRFLGTLRERLATHGFVEGRNLALEPRHVGFSRKESARHTIELANSKVDALFTISTIATQGAQDATKSLPIVFSWVADPVFSGIVPDYARPGGNVTGVSNRFFELVAKRLELVRELSREAKRVVVFAGIFDSTLQAALARAAPAADQLGLQLLRKEVGEALMRKEPAGIGWKEAFGEAGALKPDAVLVMTPFVQFGVLEAARQVISEAARLRIPTIYADAASVELGGLMTYVTNIHEDIRRGADYLARVLKGESPATLAIDQASRFELLINMKAASAIGLKIPQVLLVRADRVIE